MSKVTSLGLLSILLLSACIGVHLAYSQQSDVSNVPAMVQEHRLVVGLIRCVNTAEAERRLKGLKYTSLQDILQDKSFLTNTRARFRPVLTDASTGKLKSYNVTVVASPDGDHYTVTARSKGCVLSFYSDEAAVIYRGDALGCPLTEAASGEPAASQ